MHSGFLWPAYPGLLSTRNAFETTTAVLWLPGLCDVHIHTWSHSHGDRVHTHSAWLDMAPASGLLQLPGSVPHVHHVRCAGLGHRGRFSDLKILHCNFSWPLHCRSRRTGSTLALRRKKGTDAVLCTDNSGKTAPKYGHEMDADHINRWVDGGKTELNNARCLCYSCNRSR